MDELSSALAFEDEGASHGSGGADACYAELGVAAGHFAGQGGDDAAAGGGPRVPYAKDQEPEGTRSFIIDYGMSSCRRSSASHGENR